jgi:hypothetical protein
MPNYEEQMRRQMEQAAQQQDSADREVDAALAMQLGIPSKKTLPPKNAKAILHTENKRLRKIHGANTYKRKGHGPMNKAR